MRIFRNHRVFLAIFCLSVLFSGVIASNAQSEQATPPADAVASVNGEFINRAEYERALMRRMQNVDASQRDLMARQVLDALIEQVIIEQAAAEVGVMVSEDAVNAQMDQLRSVMETDSEWQTFLQTNSFTEAELRAAQREALLTQRIRDLVVSGLSGDVLQARARHILVRTEAEAREVIQRLQAGESFAALAQAVSVDQVTRENGGELGWFTPEELVDQNLAQVIFSLQPGQVAGPVASQLGFHIVQTQAIEERPIEAERMPVLMETTFINWLDDRIAAADIERYIDTDTN